MRRKFHKAKPKEIKKFRFNHQIRVPEVFLIDEIGEQIGVIATSEAIARAEEIGLDLVEVNPTAEPPVAKIVNMGQLRYEQEKKAHKQRVLQKKTETKSIRLSVRISQHDFDFRLNQAMKFLEKNNKLKLELLLKGREKQHPQKATETINTFVAKLKENEALSISEEQPLTKQGGRFSILLTNNKKS